MDGLESHLLQYATHFDCEDLVEPFEGKPCLDEEFFENKVMSILSDFEDFVILDGLSNKLAWRGFYRDHTKAEIKKMAKEHGDYFSVPLYDYEKKYWDEFEKHGYERLEIRE